MLNREKPLVSIIIPSWFTPDQHGQYGYNETFWFASECLKKMIERTDRTIYELIIVDNGSTLNDQNITDKPTSDIPCWSPSEYWKNADILIRNKENLGFAPACNQGFEIARGEYICCMNNDIVVWPGWLDALLEPFNIPFEKEIGVTMPALMRETKDARVALSMETIDLKKNAGDYGMGAEFGSLWVAPKTTLNKVRCLNMEEIDSDYVFDENFKLGMGEDRKLWRQVRMLGLETCRTHKTRVYHMGNASIGKVKDRKVYTEKNREYLDEWKKKHNID
jgi:GT2 family glycosyltransferase